LLSSEHNLETFEVGEGSSGTELVQFFLYLGGDPLLLELESCGSLDESTASGTSKDWHSNFSECKLSKGEDDSWEFTHSIDQHSLSVKDINNDDQSAVVFTIIDETNSTWLNEFCKTL